MAGQTPRSVQASHPVRSGLQPMPTPPRDINAVGEVGSDDDDGLMAYSMMHADKAREHDVGGHGVTENCASRGKTFTAGQ